MGQIIVILIVIAIFGLLLGLLGLVCQILVITALSWGVAIPLIFLTQYLFRVQKIYRLNANGTLSKITSVYFDGQRLNWNLDESKIESYANIKLGVIITLGIALSWVVFAFHSSLFYLYNIWGFQDVTFSYFGDTERVDPELSVVIGYIISGIVVLVATSLSKPGDNFKNALKKRAHCLVSRVNSQLKRTEELRSLETSIKSISLQLRIAFPIDFQSEIRKFVEDHKTKLLSDVTGLNKLISRNIKQAQEDTIHLEKSNNLYDAAMKLYIQTSREVNRTFSRPLITELEYIYEGLTSDNLMYLLPNRKWSDFHDVVNSIIRDIERLSKVAIKYDTEEERDETEEEIAYNILSIPPTATDDQIKKAYKTLASIWHPDTKTVKDDTRMKQINWAYEFLNDKRKFV